MAKNLFLMCDSGGDKKAKAIKKCIIKQNISIKTTKKCLENNQIILSLQQRFKSESHNVFIEEVNKIALSFNGDKRLQSFNKA